MVAFGKVADRISNSIVVCFGVLAISTVAVGDSYSAFDQIRAEIREGFSKFNVATSHTAGKAQWRFARIVPVDSYSHETRVSFMRSGDFTLFERQYLGLNNDIGDMFVNNDQYSFHLIRDSQFRPWKLAGRYDLSQRPAMFRNNCQKLGPYNLDELWFPDVILDDRFNIIETVADAEGITGLVRLRFKFQRRNKSDRVLGGDVTLDRNCNFAIKAYSVSVDCGDLPCRINSITTFRNVSNGVVLDYEMANKISEGDGPIVAEENKTVSFDCAKPNEGSFFLTKYGFPEPVGVTRSRPRDWVKTAALFVLLACAFWIGVVWRKRRQTLV